MEEIKSLEDYKIEANRNLDHENMLYEDKVRKINDEIEQINLKIEYEKQRQSTIRNQMSDSNRAINEQHCNILQNKAK